MYKVACFENLLCLLFFYKLLRFPEGFFATFILICSYFISGLSAGNKKCVYIYLHLILLLSVILNVITMYINFILDVELN